ncbi:RICIN domain-containing protein [Streptomyces sp. NBC_00370]|uniref:RICIN domain-containing protein n=1 Tax=Streptomyces sp. NBC_00370 TaxID=2975728 RepID=UPI002E261249
MAFALTVGLAAVASGSASADPNGSVTPGRSQAERTAGNIPRPLALPGIRNANSGKCLLVRGTADNAPVVQISCDSQYRDQLWQIEPIDGEGRVRIRNLNSNKCLLVRGIAEGAQAVQTTCANYIDQYWILTADSLPGTTQIANANSYKCLVARGTADNAPVVQTACGQYRDQFWFVAG